jgi:thiamine-phosphate pyrophosphorylase
MSQDPEPTRPSLDLRVYVLLDPEHAGGRPLADIARAAIDGGATILQMRAKHASNREFLAMTEAVLAVARPAGIPVLVNDRVDVALAAGADGVHVGADDIAVVAARAMLGPDAWIGYSAATPEAARQGLRDGADYLGAGDVFGTASKADAGAPIGLDGLEAVVRATELPVVAIGAVNLGNAADCIRAGAAGVAVISAVLGAADVEAAVRGLRAIIDGAETGGAIGSRA